MGNKRTYPSKRRKRTKAAVRRRKSMLIKKMQKDNLQTQINIAENSAVNQLQSNVTNLEPPTPVTLIYVVRPINKNKRVLKSNQSHQEIERVNCDPISTNGFDVEEEISTVGNIDCFSMCQCQSSINRRKILVDLVFKMYKMFDLSEICMLCLSQQNLQSMLKVDPDGFTIIDKLRTFLREPIRFEPEIPQNICNNCLVNLNYIHSFRLICLENIRAITRHVEGLQLEKKQFKNISVVTVSAQKYEDPLQLGNQNDTGTYYDDSMNTNFPDRIVTVNSVCNKDENTQEKNDTNLSGDVMIIEDNYGLKENIKIEHDSVNNCQTIFEVFQEDNDEQIIIDIQTENKDTPNSTKENIKKEHDTSNSQTSYEDIRELNEEINIDLTNSSIQSNTIDNNEIACINKDIKIEYDPFDDCKSSYEMFKEFNEEICILPETTIKTEKIEQDDSPNTCQAFEIGQDFNEENEDKQTLERKKNKPKYQCDGYSKPEITIKTGKIEQDTCQAFENDPDYNEEDKDKLVKLDIKKNKPKYQCDGCSKTYVIFNCLKKHRRRHDFLKNVKLVQNSLTL